ncbi:hypothetical protein HPB51_005793 [Rhipicephalus microplus]|uniref:E3 ubiquitin-protein ligase Topors n=1 Tax=Rhipicephalus microplus TaxID=6941 RepID=A0A9J6EMP7_RHIMP|nr:hypothetical protein HPB51_005793 [Rhipicephalus microplus]
MASSCSSPPWHRVEGSPNGNSAGSPSKLAPTDATPDRPCSRNTNSPEESCAICLGQPENKSFTDSCLHQFCFACLAEWAKVKAECPLCKQRFKSIIHSVRSLEDYDQFFVSDLPRPPASHTQVYEQRFRFPTTMTFERRQELAATAQRHARHFAANLTSRNRYLPRGATTSDERLHLYLLDLWAIPCLSNYREASPEFYRENPACTHRLVPWINRELNALLRQNRSRVVAAIDHVMGLILSFDIRHPQFARNMEPFLGKPSRAVQADPARIRTDGTNCRTAQLTSAGPQRLFCIQGGGGRNIHGQRRRLRQFRLYRGKSGQADQERTPEVIELLSSDEEELASRDNCQAGPSNQEAGPSSSSGPSEERKPHKRCAGTGSSSSDTFDEYPQKRCSPHRLRSDSSSSDARDRRPRKRRLRTRKRFKTERDSEQHSEKHVSSSRSRWRQQREERRGADRSRQSSTSSDRFGHPPAPRSRKLVSVLGAVSISGKSHEVSDQERHHSRHRRHERRSKKKSTRKQKQKRRSSSPEF